MVMVWTIAFGRATQSIKVLRRARLRASLIGEVLAHRGCLPKWHETIGRLYGSLPGRKVARLAGNGAPAGALGG
jgi:hypothetical protein